MYKVDPSKDGLTAIIDYINAEREEDKKREVGGFTSTIFASIFHNTEQWSINSANDKYYLEQNTGFCRS